MNRTLWVATLAAMLTACGSAPPNQPAPTPPAEATPVAPAPVEVTPVTPTPPAPVAAKSAPVIADVAPPEVACLPRTAAVQRPRTKLRSATKRLITDSCFAMTRDGSQAVFLLSSSDLFAGEEGEPSVDVTWFGEGTPPEIDLACLVDSCSRRAVTKMHADAKKAGLTPCHAIDSVRVDGKDYPLSAKKDQLWITVKGHPAHSFHTLSMEEHDGGDHETLQRFFQHPHGGPIFALILNEDTGLSEQRVEVFSEAALGFCPATPTE